MQLQTIKDWPSKAPVVPLCSFDAPEAQYVPTGWGRIDTLSRLAQILHCAPQAKWNPNKTRPEDFVLLETAAQDRNERAFLRALRTMTWLNKSAHDFVYGVQLALQSGAHLAARQIASEGLSYYPENSDIQRYVHGLAPAQVISRNLPSNPTLRANREWLHTHSQEYRGRWVAIRNGELLGTANSLSELTKQVTDRTNILFTKAR